MRNCNFICSAVRFVLLLSITQICCNSSLGQPANLKLERLDSEHGLTQNLVYAVAQDSLGFLWFATDEGLNRFDGYEFKIFRHLPNDSRTIVDNSVHSLFFDKGILWIGTNNGISQYHLATERIRSLPIDYNDESKLSGNSVNVIKKDDQGRIWIAYLGSGVDVITPGGKKILHYTVNRDKNDPYRLPNDYVIVMEFLGNGEKMLGTRNGFYFLNTDGTVMTDQEVLRKYPWRNKIDYSVRCSLLSRDKKILWLGTESNGMYRIDLATGAVRNFNMANGSLLFNNNTPSVFEDTKGNTWIGGEAIYLFDEKKNELVPYNEFGIRRNVTIRNPVMTIFEDKDRNLWFGTFRLGVLKYNPEGVNILHLHAGQGEGSIGNNQVLSFGEEPNGDVLVGTDGGGLYRYSKATLSFEQAPLNGKFSSQVIKCIHRDLDNSYWLGTWDGGMMNYNPSQNKLAFFDPEHKNFNTHHVWEIIGDSLNNLWIATLRDGVFYYDRKHQTFKNFRSDATDPYSLINNDVLCIYLNSKNTLWVGTADGLSVLKAGSNKFMNKQKKDSIGNVLCFYEDQQNRMWLGTNGGGIVITDSEARVLKTITAKDGLPSTTICGIVPDRDHNLWVSTYNGIVKINVMDFSVNIIPNEAGLQGKEFIPRSAFKTSDGKILFGGVNGFNVLNTDSFKITASVPDIVFTSIKVQNEEILPDSTYFGRKILSTSISQTQTITLHYSDNSFTLTFSPLVYNLQKNIRYRYKLENFDAGWQYTDSKTRSIHYTNIDPGQYALFTEASFDGKTWTGSRSALKIAITPPWWATTTVRSLEAVLAVLFLYGVYKVRTRLLRAQRKRLEALVQSRTIDLRKSNDEIKNLLDKLASQKNQIEEQNHELLQVNDAVVNQRDALEVKSKELEMAQEKLKETNSNLELLIAERTYDLSHALRELETFLYRASHDLRGPITSMLGLINVASIEKKHFSEDYINLITKSVHQLDHTLDMLLLKYTLDQKKIAPENFDKTALLNFIPLILNSLPFYQEEDFKLNIHNNIDVRVDQLMLKTILTELLKNAFFFARKSKNREVKLEMQQNHEYLVIEVSDHGPGIKSEMKDKIFQMFYRGHEMSTGNGLGLYMVKSALQKIRGKIEVDSEEGQYTIFKASLPTGLS